MNRWKPPRNVFAVTLNGRLFPRTSDNRQRHLHRNPDRPARMTVSSGVDLSCGLPPGPDFVELTALAERLGYSRVWIFDSAPLWEDPFVHLALAAVSTKRIGLATAVLVPSERAAMTMASSIATVARLCGDRFTACFGTGYTSRLAAGQRPMPLDSFVDYVAAVRSLLAGETVIVEGKSARMQQASGLAADRPIGVPIWLSVFGPRGMERAGEIADGIIGPPHPTLPTATMISGTVLDDGEDRDSDRVRRAVGPWRVSNWHSAYATGGAPAVDSMPGGETWRSTLEQLAPDDERHLLTFEGHVTHLTDRDLPLLDHIDLNAWIGDVASIGRKLGRLAEAGFREVIFTPTGPDVRRELTAFAAAQNATK